MRRPLAVLELRHGTARETGDVGQLSPLQPETHPGRLKRLAISLHVFASQLLAPPTSYLDCRGTVLIIEGTKTKNAKRTLELDAPMVRELLLRHCEPFTPEALLFAEVGATAPRAPSALWKWLVLFCKRAGLPRVCPHSLRGLHSSLAVKVGATSAYVARALGHGSDAVTRKHYLAPDALDSARSARVVAVLLGDAELEGIIATLRNLPSDQLDRVCSAVGLHR